MGGLLEGLSKSLLDIAKSEARDAVHDSMTPALKLAIQCGHTNPKHGNERLSALSEECLPLEAKRIYNEMEDRLMNALVKLSLPPVENCMAQEPPWHSPFQRLKRHFDSEPDTLFEQETKTIIQQLEGALYGKPNR